MPNVTLTEEQKKDPKTILDALGDYFKAAKNVIYERYTFGCCKQGPDEPIDSFITKLREKASSCEYRDLKDELIRDRLVLGIASESTRRRLLRERDLTLPTAVEICRLAELTESRMRLIESPQAQVDSINSMVDRQGGRRKIQWKTAERNTAAEREQQWTCKYCGNGHKRGREQCPAYGKTCRACGVSNHFAKVCQASSRAEKTRKVNVVEDVQQTEGDSDTSENLYNVTEYVGNVKAPGRKWFVHLHLNKKRQLCQLDTGATCNVMGRQFKEKLSPKTALQPTRTRLKLYSDTYMPSLGKFHTDCVVRGKIHRLVFEIVNTKQKPLLGGAACTDLGLVKFTIPRELLPAEVNTIDASQSMPLTKEMLLKDFHDVFHDPIESVPGNIHFDLNPEVTPVQCSPRNVPVALKARVKEELDKHVKAGNLTPVTEPTAWISNMVTVAKPDKIRICIDPKPLNQALLRSHYHMPTLEDVLYKLPKARVFTLVDARDAFLQCKLDEESSRLTTFWTPWGRMRWLKLPFGVSVAPEIYQRKQHELLSGLAGIEPIADDILVVGCGDTDAEAEEDHNTNLRALMQRCRAVKLRLSERKLQFKLKAVHFHGHVLSTEGLKIDPEKPQAVLDMPTPTDAKAVQRMIGFVTYLAKFLPGLSEICEPLRRLLDKDTAWHWLPKHDDAIREIKRMVTNTPVLKYYDVTKPVTIQSSDTPYVRQAVCSMDSFQVEDSELDQAQHLDVTDFRFRQIAQHTEMDDVLQALTSVILRGWPDFKEDTPLLVREYWPFRDELNVQNSVLYRGQCVVIPKALREELLRRIHTSHIGGEACYRRARDTLFWPNMRTEIKDYVSNCSACNEYARAQQKESLMSHDIPTRPWQTVSMDIFSYAGQDFIVLVDHYSDF
ncbi:uncharacterized protein K02A2.6-like [Gymnodraco acuticeps]|uniref:Gypsy retrotransposon integrase-like protein 1 n=1 Tax=Gymnodraco acuticeps TaxID=8218 RepID=A0A6P8TQC4_GYMAC|nr:uncharacterized protein K02A2.6-like [Gymnodraco acuticeps]